MSTDFRALCAELLAAADEYAGMNPYMRLDNAMKAARAALAQQHVSQPYKLPEPVAPTDEELIEPIVWMIDERVYDNDKGEIAESLRELITRWGTPANTTREEI